MIQSPNLAKSPVTSGFITHSKCNEDQEPIVLIVSVHPVSIGRLPVTKILGVREPESDLVVGGVYSVTAMDDVTTDLDTKISSDGARLAVSGISFPQHNSAGLDSVLTLPDHGDNRATSHVLHQTREETSSRQISIMLPKVSLARLHHPDGHQLEPLGLEPLDNLPHQTSLYPVRFDHDKGSLLASWNFSLERELALHKRVDTGHGRAGGGSCQLKFVVPVHNETPGHKGGGSTCCETEGREGAHSDCYRRVFTEGLGWIQLVLRDYVLYIG